ncbi:Chemotaxis protein CheY [Gammaproteobacteria bacterium]
MGDFMNRGSLHALVVDDMGSVRALIRAVLDEMGFNVAESSNGRDALTHLESNPVDLLVCDWNMPKMGGLEVVVSVRENPKLKNLPILMVTTEHSRDQVKEAIRAGVTDYIMKPFQINKLKARIAACLAATRNTTATLD